jgi:hypothetical protein
MNKKNPAGSGNFLPAENSKTCPVVTELKTMQYYHRTLLKSRNLSKFKYDNNAVFNYKKRSEKNEKKCA